MDEAMAVRRALSAAQYGQLNADQKRLLTRTHQYLLEVTTDYV